MATFRRALVPGGCYFFTVGTYQRQKLLTYPSVLVALRTAFDSVRSRHPFEIDAMVVLPDHLHCIWTLPPEDHDYARRWSLIKRETSRLVRHLIAAPLRPSGTRRHENGLWQRRFWEHLIRDENDFSRHVDYIHWNPVKHGLCERVVEWPHSSFHRYVRRGLLPLDWATGDIEGQFGEMN
jgi:putative transposase